MDNLIELNNITYKYHRGRTVFEDFSIDFNLEESTIITGPNGSGKTTLTKLIMGILKAQKGTINIFGENSKDLSLAEIGSLIGYVFQYPERQLFANTVVEELTFPLLLKGAEKRDTIRRAENLTKTFDLENVTDSYPQFLSYGEKRRLAIASVLMNDPKCLILDEPTASLDNERIDVLIDILHKLKEKKVGVIAISHNKDFIDVFGDRLVELKGGRIIRDEKKRL